MDVLKNLWDWLCEIISPLPVKKRLINAPYWYAALKIDEEILLKPLVCWQLVLIGEEVVEAEGVLLSEELPLISYASEISGFMGYRVVPGEVDPIEPITVGDIYKEREIKK